MMNRKLLLSFLFFCFILGLSLAQTRKWTRMETMPREAEARNHPATFTLDGKGYVATGNTIINSVFFNDVWRYDPSLNQWEQLDTFPGIARGYAYGVAHEGKAYLGFGLNPDVGFLKDLWEFDGATETWKELPSCPCEPRSHPAFLAHKGKLYLAVGGSSKGDLQDFWEYDITSQAWTQLDSFPGPKRHHPYYFEIGDFVYVGFGHSGPNIYKDMYRYDPANKIWTQVASLPDQGRVAGTQFTYNGKGYVLSGQGEDHQNFRTGEFWEYDPVINQWKDMPAHPGSGRWAPGSFLIDDKVYLTCGTPDEGDVKDLWMFDFDEISKTDLVQKDKLLFSPNPAFDFVKLNLSLIDEKQTEIQVRDAFGKSIDLKYSDDGVVNLSGIPSGFYTFSVQQGGEWKFQKIFITGK